MKSVSLETNESIVGRNTVVIDSRKKIGKVKGLRVDADTREVNYFVISNEGTGSDLALPFDKALATGDTFVTVQNRDQFVPTADGESSKIVQEGFKLTDTEVYSVTGNLLGTVKGFEFDSVYGSITKITLDDRSSFDADVFTFFSPEFVFLDDGAPTAAEIRAGVEEDSDDSASDEDAAVAEADTASEDSAESSEAEVEEVSDEAPAEAEVAEVAAEAETTAEFKAVVADEAATPEKVTAEETDAVVEAAIAAVVETAEKEAEAAAPVAPAVPVAEPVAETADEAVIADAIDDSLIGLTTEADIVSVDGEFKVARGTVLTREIVADAAKHDALLLLAVNVEV